MSNRYDLLFGDLKGTEKYYDFVSKHIKGNKILEFASGTGDLLQLLDKEYDVVGVDIDEAMIDSALKKYPTLKDKLKIGNFLDYKTDETYDTVICVGDSLNYMHDEEELKQFVTTASKLSDHIIVDFHHPYRLTEFEEPYFEEGSFESFDYAYQIQIEEDYLVHTINYLDGQFEQVIQWVFEPKTLIQEFEKLGYESQLFTDFDTQGIQQEGEKVMAIFSKVNT